eukprot:gene19212-6402_t
MSKCGCTLNFSLCSYDCKLVPGPPTDPALDPAHLPKRTLQHDKKQKRKLGTCDEVDCNGLVKARKKCRTHDAIAHPDKYKQP